MADILAAASVLLTVITILYSLWYPEIIMTLDKSIPRQPDDRAKPLREIRTIICIKARPLTIISWIIAIIFFPDVYVIIRDTFKAFIDKQLSAFHEYSAVAASVVVVDIIIFILAAYLTHITYRLIKKRDDYLK